MSNLRILIADDHKIVRVGIRFTLESSNPAGFISKFDEASNGYEAVQLCKVYDYDVIFMDINMPEMDGISATKEIINEKKDARIIAISMHDEEYQVRQMIEAGAKGYLLKNTGPEILNAAIDAVVKGGHYFSNEVAVKLLQLGSADPGRSQAPVIPKHNNEVKLSPRERQILTLIANEHTNEEIAKALSLSKRTVDSHRQNIINKLNLKNTAGLIKYAIKNNLI